ncbi:hypothetical protein ANANG_G00287630 [Anguilla anguilla]|uniref:Phosphatidylinositol transfer protein N-terminal domain-containing protein n=1 Tax=Anguilla anguilla TaxID=7936 RepID=A0A9D3RJ91_ANGAN|nr:hypothetical protein ANANG_G00287630 [Anguilla anguilla]
MLVKEYRICMPLTVEEYRIGQLYTICKHSHEASDKGRAWRWCGTRPTPTPCTGRVSSRRREFTCPAGCQAGPKLSSLVFFTSQKSLGTTILTQSQFAIHIETKYEDNCGINENIFSGDKNEIDQEVDFLDIAFDDVPDRHYRTSEDPRHFSSVKTGRGPLQEGWRESSRPVMCSYKQVAVQFEVWGLQTRVEQFVHKVIRDVLLVGHRQAFAWVDEWYGMTLEDVRKFESQMHLATNQKLGYYEP